MRTNIDVRTVTLKAKLASDSKEKSEDPSFTLKASNNKLVAILTLMLVFTHLYLTIM